MRVLFWVPYPTEESSNRYRVEQYLPYLKLQKIEYSHRPFWNKSAYRILYKPRHYFKKFCFFIFGTLSRIFDLMRIMQYDIVFILREAYPIGGPFFETALNILGRPFIFDFDDALFLLSSSGQNNFIRRLKKPAKIAKIIRMSNRVITGNSYLADFALKFNNDVQIIPTCVDTDKYYPESKKHSNKLIIGWIGSTTTINFLKMMDKVFAVLSKKFSNVTFKIVGGDFSLDGVPNIISKRWSLGEEVRDLRTFDIGIMPMPDNDWTKGKCGFKAILYMSMGIPCVCSPVGVNKEIISDGINGFLADTENDWIRKLSLLIENPGLRIKMGLAGRKLIEEKYSVKVNVSKFLETIQQVYNEKCRKLT